LRTGLKNAQKDVKYFGRNVTGSLKEMRGQIAGIAAGLGGGLFIKGGIQDAMRFESLMTTLGESMGDSRKQFEEWQETAGNAFGYSRLQSAETANLLSLNFKEISDSQEDLVKKTTKMMEIAAVISNKRGMTMQEVSDRIRSAMNGEADGADELGVNVRISAMKMSKAYQEMANGQPWDQLTDQMQRTIRYHHILDQVSERLGSTMQDTTALRMAQFTASLSDVKLALGQAFLPILYKVLPYLNAMAQALYKVLQVVAAFSRSLFGGGFVYKAPKGFADVAKKDAQAIAGVGDASEEAGEKSSKAAKKAAKAWTGIFGFDEVNTIKEPDESADAGGGAGGGGAGGLSDVAPDEPESLFKPLEEAIDELAKKMDKYTRPIKKAFKAAFDFIAGYVGEKIKWIKDYWAENGEMIIQAAKNIWNVVGPVLSAVFKFILDSVKMVVDGTLNVFGGLIKFLAGAFTGDWEKTWEGLRQFFFGIVEALYGFWNLTFIGGIKKLLLNFIKDALKEWYKFVDDFKKFFGNGLTNIKKLWADVIKYFKNLWDDFKDSLKKKITAQTKDFRDMWTGVKQGADDAVKALKKVWGTVVSWFTRTIVNPIISAFTDIQDAFSGGIGEGVKYLVNQFIDGINEGIRTLNGAINKMPFGNKVPNIPTIPRLARGGITNGPTLAMVGDNVGGREVISPLDRLESMLTNSVIQAMQLGGGNNGQNSGDIVLNIDGRSFARIVKPYMDKEKGRVGSDVRIRPI
jgi:phage-related protein